MISVFDVEEVGIDVLTNEVGIPQELADSLLVHCAEQAKIVAEQQQKEKEEEERRRAEEAKAADAVLAGEIDPSADAVADSILGGGPVEETASDSSAEAPEATVATEDDGESAADAESSEAAEAPPETESSD